MQQDRPAPVIDWSAIERSRDFRELTTSRRRFAARAGTLGIGLGALYVVLANAAPDVMDTEVLGGMSLGFLGGVLLILLTWAITWAYLRRSATVWAPLEERIRAQATSGGAAADDARTGSGRFAQTGVDARVEQETPR
jgi:uncharacterized membrane protein (DUF485 family)